MQVNVITQVQIEGLHFWEGAQTILPKMNFLANIHRHIFYITIKKQVFHDDRDTEFINFKHDIISYLQNKYYSKEYCCLLFNSKSCEMIAKELLNKFNANYCSVFEDNENGAEVINNL